MRPQLFALGEKSPKLFGLTKYKIIKMLQQASLAYSEFCHWLFVPVWGVVISFAMTDRGMTCCQIGKLDVFS